MQGESLDTGRCAGGSDPVPEELLIKLVNVLEQEIFPISLKITGNVAVAYYAYRTARENYKKERETVNGR
jgi:hypothetical protein